MLQGGEYDFVVSPDACINDGQPNAERTQRLFSSLREELEKRGKMSDSNGVGS